MPPLKRILRSLTCVEHIALGILGLLFIGSLALLLQRFYLAETVLVADEGGTYIEGAVGSLRPLNPWFTPQSDVNRDITSLVFCKLVRYDPFTRTVDNDAATLRRGDDGRTYTATIRDGVAWHDTTDDQPRPVTADDVIFTFQTIQSPGFENPILQRNFRGVTIEKLDERRVQFTLNKPYAFFPSSLTLGLLPRHHFLGIPADRMSETLDFGFAPIGCGPYTFRSIVETDLSTEVTLEKFPHYYGQQPHIERLVFRIFPDYASLLSDLRNLDGVRQVPRRPDRSPAVPRRFQTYSYTLPQYVALFFNLDRAIPSDSHLRLALQLATDKRAIASTIGEEEIIDTPLLEIRPEEWEHHFDLQAAQGALFDSAWHLPEKIRLQHLLEIREQNTLGELRLPDPVVLLSTGAQLTVTGTFLPPPPTLNGVSVRPLAGASSGTWIARLPTEGATGSILVGENALRLVDPDGSIRDTFTITRARDEAEFRRLREEQRIVDRFLRTKRERAEGRAPSHEDTTIEHLFVEEGILRSRLPSHPASIRRNDQGLPLTLSLLTSSLPPSYPRAAALMAQQWRALGAEVTVIVPSDRAEFERRVIERDYDLLLFGQPLLDNFDLYPYWHSSQAQVPQGQGDFRLDAQNLSQYRSFEADTLLEQIRSSSEESRRRELLEKLQVVFRRDTPALVLYSPLYVFAVERDIQGIELGSPSLHIDRFAGLPHWYVRERRVFRPGRSWWSFLGWLPNLWSGAGD